MNQPTPDELAATGDALDDLGHGVSTPTGAAPGEGTVQVLVRVPAESRERWKQAADASGTSMSDFVRQVVDARATEVLDCPHPQVMRKLFPWAEICRSCGKRLWENPRVRK